MAAPPIAASTSLRFEPPRPLRQRQVAQSEVRSDGRRDTVLAVRACLAAHEVLLAAPRVVITPHLGVVGLLRHDLGEHERGDRDIVRIWCTLGPRCQPPSQHPLMIRHTRALIDRAAPPLGTPAPRPCTVGAAWAAAGAARPGMIARNIAATASKADRAVAGVAAAASGDDGTSVRRPQWWSTARRHPACRGDSDRRTH